MTLFAAQAKSEDTKWRERYWVDPGKPHSSNIERQIRSLSSDDTMKGENIKTFYELTREATTLEGNVSCECTRCLHPNTQFIEWFSECSARGRRQVAPADGSKTTLFERPKTPFVLC